MSTRLHAGVSNARRTKKLIVRRMPADLETPVSAFLKLKDSGAKLLLESVESGTILGRYSFIGIAPTTRIVVDPVNVTMFTTEGRITVPFHANDNGDGPLAPIKQLLGTYEISGGNSHPPLLGGVVGYISYDLVRHFERIPDSSYDSLGLPLATFYLVDTLLVFDHVKRSLEFLALADESDEQQVREKVDNLVAATQSPLKIHEKSSVESGNHELKSNLSREEFCSAVKAIKEYIAAGEV